MVAAALSVSLVAVSLVTVIFAISMTGAVLVPKDPTTPSMVAGAPPAMMSALSEAPQQTIQKTHARSIRCRQ